MPRVFCSIPGCEPGVINGQEFEAHEPGVLVSVGEVSPENLEVFSSVPGYSVEDDAAAAVSLQKAADKAMADAEAASKRAREAAEKAAEKAEAAKAAAKAPAAPKNPAKVAGAS